MISIVSLFIAVIADYLAEILIFLGILLLLLLFRVTRSLSSLGNISC